jgi:predicted glycosyltransferase
VTRRAPILFYCQHSLGVGHAQRAARLARALVEAGEHVLFVTGGLPVPGLDLGGAEKVPLPPLTAGDDTATTLVTPEGRVPDAEYLAARRDRLLKLVAVADPAVVLLELFPFGRHALADELGALVLALADDRARRGPRAPRLAVSVRDILVSKRNQPWYELSVLAVVRQWIDCVLVHGSPDVIPLSRTFALADRLADRLVYTGYVGSAASPAAAPRPHGEIVVSAGGGRVAAAFFQAALAARAGCRAGAARPWRLLTGPYLTSAAREDLDALTRQLAPVGRHPAVVVEAFRPDFPALLRGAALSVSQAGYNTVLDVLASGVRAVVVPFEESGDEQVTRARLLAERGWLRVVEAGPDLPVRLAAAIDDALADREPAPAALDLDGAARAVAVLTAMVDAVTRARSDG